MALLTGQTIASSYLGLLSVSGAVGTDTLEPVTDAANTATSLSLSQQRASFTLGTGSGDMFTINSTMFVVDGQTSRCGMGTLTPDGVLNLETAGDTCALYLDTYDAHSADCSTILFRHSLSNSSGDVVALDTDAYIGHVTFQGVNSSDAFVDSARMSVKNPNAPGGTYCGGEFQFSAADNDQAMTQRMVIDKDGYVGIGEVSPDSMLHVSDAVSGYTLKVENLGNATDHHGIMVACGINGVGAPGSDIVFLLGN